MNQAIEAIEHASTEPPPLPSSVSLDEASRVLVDLALDRANAIELLKAAYADIHDLRGSLQAVISSAEAAIEADGPGHVLILKAEIVAARSVIRRSKLVLP